MIIDSDPICWFAWTSLASAIRKGALALAERALSFPHDPVLTCGVLCPAAERRAVRQSLRQMHENLRDVNSM
jgi:hypothetical protein